ncbi:GcrA family cell cycle regulator [Sinirhodobacter huangdaonensis]|uniref:GcrA cell cycle regulator n=1 Tax=Paenirhodobacter huangdaonensis TaxID=2501515 RepID=A0A3S3LDY0_9RHOB|nr:GcrA family cell cycle regulator [Sinirhodobacter huangdaonensis]RWR53253.1 GcrA cell cycle regulator [Sinirhodobacter huangdaonensis]
MSWTDERVELLKKMWSEGQSASQIAKELGGVTRNAVIGKVHRLGLSNRAGAEGAAPEAEAPAAKPAVDPAPTPEPVATRPEPAPEPVRAAPAQPVRPAAAPRPEPVAAVATPAMRKPVVPAGQPLPPQPSLNEISPETLASVREVEKRSRKISLMELTERTCKWPIGDPATDNFYFCGLPSQPGKPYCEAHVSVAFQPMSTRRDRRR